MQKVQFDTTNDFTWIICMTGYTFGLMVRTDSPIKDSKDLVAFAKVSPGEFTYGSPVIGTSPHLAIEQFAAPTRLGEVRPAHYLPRCAASSSTDAVTRRTATLLNCFAAR